MNRTVFYQEIKNLGLFSKLTNDQVKGIETMLNEYQRLQWTDLRWLAYICATVYHETARLMMPVKEYGGESYLKKKPYYPYYGRDLVHTTWQENYKKAGKFLGIDLVKYPEKIAELENAVKVAFHFMEKGYYTGRKLGDYFNEKEIPEKPDSKVDPWIQARRIINILDKAEMIKGYALKFHTALIKATSDATSA